MTRVVLGVLNSMLGPTYSPIKIDVPYDGPLEGQSPWDIALITLGFARRCLFYFILDV